MEISYGYIVEYLSKHFTVLAYSEECHSSYTMPVLYRSERQIEPKRIYVVDVEAFNDKLSQENVLAVICSSGECPLAGTKNTTLHKNCCETIHLGCFPSDNPAAVFESLYDLFYQETIWLECLTTLCINGENKGIQRFLDVSIDKFEGVLLYLPVGGWRSCAYASRNDWETTVLRGLLNDKGDGYALEVDFSGIADAIGSTAPKESKIVDAFGAEINVLAITVQSPSKDYAGLLVAPWANKQAIQSYLWRIKRLCEAMEVLLSSNFFLDEQESVSPHAMLKQLISGDISNIRDTKKRLNTFGFTTHDTTYVCIAVSLTEINETAISPRRYCNTIENMANGIIAIEYKGDILALIDVRSRSVPYGELLETMKGYFRLNKVQIGVSFEFSDIFLLKNYAEQAISAMQIGSSICPVQAIHRFSDVVVPYILTHGTTELPARMLCIPGLLNLEKKTNGTDLMDTLRVYVKNLYNASQTAHDLFIHRSTLTHRLSQISQALHMDLDNADNRFYIEISLRLLDQG